MDSPASSSADLQPIPSNPAELSSEKVLPYVNETFQLHWHEAAAEPVVLLDVTSHAKHGRSGFRDPFSMHFRAGKRDFYVPQGMYAFSHPQAGRVEWFIVPVGPDEVGMVFEVVFN